MLATPVLLLAFLPAAEPLPQLPELGETKFVTRDLDVVRISSGESVPGHRAGHLVVDFDFEAVEPGAGGAFSVPPFDFAFRLVATGSTEYVVPGSEPRWWTAVDALPAASLKRFSPSSGEGTATLQLPIRHDYGVRGRGPAFPMGDVRCEVLVSLDGPLDVAGGAPGGAEVAFDFDLSVDYPEAWVEIPSGAVPVAGSSELILFARDPLPSDRDYVVVNRIPGLVELRDEGGAALGPTVAVAAGTIGTRFRATGLEPGWAHVALQTVDGAAVSSNPDVHVSMAIPGTAPQSSTGYPGAISASVASHSEGGGGGGGFYDPDEEPLEVGNFKRCIKAAHVNHGVFNRVCSECALNPDVPDACNGDLWFAWTPAQCVPTLWLRSCYTAPPYVDAVPTYTMEGNYGADTNGCPWVQVSVGGAIKVVSGHVSGAVQTSKFCCILRRLPDSEWVTLHLQQCYGL